MPTVLIVESDDDLREVLTEGLQLAGWTTAPARNGRDAVDVARRCAIDVVLADTLLSDHEGQSLELAFGQSPELHAIPFVFMTVFPPEVARLGRDRTLLKPFTFEEACRALDAQQRPVTGVPSYPAAPISAGATVSGPL